MEFLKGGLRNYWIKFDREQTVLPKSYLYSIHLFNLPEKLIPNISITQSTSSGSNSSRKRSPIYRINPINQIVAGVAVLWYLIISDATHNGT